MPQSRKIYSTKPCFKQGVSGSRNQGPQALWEGRDASELHERFTVKGLRGPRVVDWQQAKFPQNLGTTILPTFDLCWQINGMFLISYEFHFIVLSKYKFMVKYLKGPISFVCLFFSFQSNENNFHTSQ